MKYFIFSFLFLFLSIYAHAQKSFGFKVENANSGSLSSDYLAHYSKRKFKDDLPKPIHEDIKKITGWEELLEVTFYPMNVTSNKKTEVFWVIYAYGEGAGGKHLGTARYFIYSKKQNKLIQIVYPDEQTDNLTGDKIREYMLGQDASLVNISNNFTTVKAGEKTYIVFDNVIPAEELFTTVNRYVFSENGEYLGTLKVTDKNNDLKDYMFAVLMRDIEFKK